MPLLYQANGTLVPGVHNITIEEFEEEFIYNEERRKLYTGLLEAIEHLKCVGCSKIYIDGSFVTKKVIPSDFDLCWDETNVNFELLKKDYYSLMDFGFKMKKMKERYGGDIVPKSNHANIDTGITFFGFFQEDRQGRPKGIIELILS